VQRFYAWLRNHPTLVDGAWAFLLLGLSGLEVIGEATAPGHDMSRALQLTFVAVVLCAAVALRRKLPLTALFAVIGAGVFQLASDTNPGISSMAMPVIVYNTAAYTPRWSSMLSLAGSVFAPVLAQWRWGSNLDETGSFSRGESIFLALLMMGPFVVAWVLGDSMRTRRAYFQQLEEKAVRLEKERDAQAQIAAAGERARIARELHDVVAHNVSAMVVQADGAAYAMDSSPEMARKALETISNTGREALAEMRRLLGVLRAENEANQYVPQPGVEQLTDLVERAREVGLPVDLQVEGVPVELDKGLALAVYRLVQESLTNTRKHGGPDVRAKVVMGYGDRELNLTVSDDGRGAAAPSDGMGHGMVGMRERVSMMGGTLSAGPRPGGGWQLRAVLPYKIGAAL
jgi:signal transduction histidine kinase